MLDISKPSYQKAKHGFKFLKACEITSPLGWTPLESRTNNIWKSRQKKILLKTFEIFCPGYFSFQQPFFMFIYLQILFPHYLLYPPKSFVHLSPPIFRRRKYIFHIQISETKSKESLISIYCCFISRKTKPIFKD